MPFVLTNAIGQVAYGCAFPFERLAEAPAVEYEQAVDPGNLIALARRSHDVGHTGGEVVSVRWLR